MAARVKAMGRFLADEFNSVAKVYFAPLVGLCKGQPISYTNEAWERRDQEFTNHLATLKRAF